MLPLVVALALSHALFGRVVETQTGKPLQDCDVHLSGLYRLAGTDADGVFALPDIPPGDYALIVTCPFHDSLRTTIHRTSAAHDTLRLALRRAQMPPFVAVARPDPTPFPKVPFGDLLVVVVDSVEHGQQGMLVRLPGLGRQAISDSVGWCMFKEVPFGRHAVEARSPIHEVFRDTVDIEGDGPLQIGVWARLYPAFTPGKVRLDARGNATALVNGTWLPVTSEGRLPKPLEWDLPKRTYRN